MTLRHRLEATGTATEHHIVAAVAVTARALAVTVLA